MKILVSNDDGILSSSLWILAKELKNIAQVTVVAPDRERSATGTSVTLRLPLRVEKAIPLVPGVEAFAVEGTPADCVILGLGRLVNNVDMVIAGINNGLNLGEDVLISGTVGAALQGYLRGLPSMAVSMAEARSPYVENAARLVTLLAQRIGSNHLPKNIFLNVNYPILPLSQIKGLKVTRLASKSHIDSVAEGHEGKEYYRLVRQQASNHHHKGTDITALDEGHISITALSVNFPNRPSLSFVASLCSGLLSELHKLAR